MLSIDQDSHACDSFRIILSFSDCVEGMNSSLVHLLCSDIVNFWKGMKERLWILQTLNMDFKLTSMVVIECQMKSLKLIMKTGLQRHILLGWQSKRIDQERLKSKRFHLSNHL